jgi:geranylgeranyl pyrophosphate synthase
MDDELARIDPREIRTPDQAESLCDRIAATGALDAARARALEYVKEAKGFLPADLTDKERTALTLVADGVVARFA